MAGVGSLEAIERRLRSRERLWNVKIVGMLVAGAPLTVLGPVLLATMFWVAAYRGLGRHLPWLELCGVLTLICVPLFIWLEVRTGGKYLIESTRGAGLDLRGHGLAPGALARGMAIAAAVANPRAVSAGLVELLLQGPRLLVGAVRQVRLRRYLRAVDRRRAAEIVAALLARADGITLTSLVGGAAPADDIGPTLSWLVFFGWAGVSADATRVYLYSTARERLRAAR